MQTPIDSDIVKKFIAASGLKSVGLASIRELNRLATNIEIASGISFIHMEMGIPGFDPPGIAVEGEIEALKQGVGSKYPPFDGIPELKTGIVAFVKNFLNIDVAPEGCLPTVGAMQGCYLAMMVAGRRFKGHDKILFIDPGFPVNKIQARVLGLPYASFDVYDFRGPHLEDKLRSYLEQGDIGAILYSNPNNPSWICFTNKELEIIGRLCTQYDVIALEDLAYFGMDFRKDYSQPGRPPYIPSVANFTANYILLISSSKSFSLAGQRIGMTAISPVLFNAEGDNLETWFGSNRFGYAYIFGGMYALSAGVCHSAQHGLARLLAAVNSGQYNFVDAVKEYGQRAREMKSCLPTTGSSLSTIWMKTNPWPTGFISPWPTPVSPAKPSWKNYSIMASAPSRWQRQAASGWKASGPAFH